MRNHVEADLATGRVGTGSGREIRVSGLAPGLRVEKLELGTTELVEKVIPSHENVNVFPKMAQLNGDLSCDYNTATAGHDRSSPKK